MGDLAEFENVVMGAMSPDNAVRQQAEVVFQNGRNNPEQFFSLLLSLICQSQKIEVRHFCAVMLRQNLKSSSKLWGQLPPNLQGNVKSTLVQLLKGEPNRTIRKSAVEAIGTLAPSLLQNGDWPDLVDEVLAVSKSGESALRESAMDLLEMLCEFCVDPLKPRANDIKAVIASCLTDQDRVRVSAVKAVVAFVIALDDHEKPHLADTVPAIFQTVSKFYEAKDDDLLTDTIEQLVNLPKCEPTFLRAHLEPVVSLFFTLTADRELSPNTRRMGMEFLLTLTEQGKGMIRKHPNFAQRAIPLAFSFLLELEHTPEWDNFEDDDDKEQQNFSMGQEAIDRFAMSLGGKIFMSVATPIIQEFLQSPDWLKRHAGLTALSTMADACKKIFKTQLDSISNMIIPFVTKDPHHRVRWAAVNGLAQLSVDFCPEFQENFHASVLPSLAEGMQLGVNHPRVVAHAALCVVDFTANVEKEIMEPYFNGFMEALLQLLQTDNVKIQESALSAVSAMALIAEDDFAPFYDAFIPGLKTILTGPDQIKLRELRGKAIECVGLIGKAVGKERFGEDAKLILQHLLEKQRGGLASDDPQYRYMVQAFSRICQCLGSDFAPYLPACIDPLLQSAAIENCGFITDADDKNEHAKEDGFETIDLALRGLGNKSLTINTALLEEKVTACNCLFEYANALEDKFFPYVERTAAILIPLLSYPFHEGIRVASIHTMPALLLSANKHAELNGGDTTFLQQLWGVMFEPLLDAAMREVSLEDLNGVLEAISEAANNLREGMITQQQVTAINTLLAQQITDSCDRRKERMERMNDPDFDQEEMDMIEEENESEDELLGYTHLVISKVCKCARGAYTADFHEKLFPLLWPLLTTPGCSKEQINAAICAFDDLIWYGQERAKQYVEGFLPIIMKHSLSDDADLRQSSVFGLGACAEAMGLAFAPAIDQTLQVLVQVITAPGSREGENEPASDCAISAVGKICDYCYETNTKPVYQNQNLFDMWLSWLPISADEEEACMNNDRLANFVMGNNPHLLGANNSNLPRIMSVFASALDTECTTPQLTARIAQIWSSIKTTQPQSVNPILAAIPEEHRVKLMAM